VVRRLGLVVHPTREIDDALATVRRWAEAHGAEVVQVMVGEGQRQVAPPGEVAACDLIVAVGGDGTVLVALRTSAAHGTPVLGLACGSLGALSAVTADELTEGLDRYARGGWTPRPVPMLGIAGMPEADDFALNDFVIIRRGAGQVAADIHVDDELYARIAGDGLIVATALGSSAYTMAAGGPIVAGATAAFVCTPVAMHGGNAPPLVVPADAVLTIDVHPGYTGFDIEIDGRPRGTEQQRFSLTMRDERLTLVTLSESGHGLGPLRRRGLIADSPRILARDARAARR